MCCFFKQLARIDLKKKKGVTSVCTGVKIKHAKRRNENPFEKEEVTNVSLGVKIKGTKHRNKSRFEKEEVTNVSLL